MWWMIVKAKGGHPALCHPPCSIGRHDRCNPLLFAGRSKNNRNLFFLFFSPYGLRLLLALYSSRFYFDFSSLSVWYNRQGRACSIGFLFENLVAHDIDNGIETDSFYFVFDFFFFLPSLLDAVAVRSPGNNSGLGHPPPGPFLYQSVAVFDDNKTRFTCLKRPIKIYNVMSALIHI